MTEDLNIIPSAENSGADTQEQNGTRDNIDNAAQNLQADEQDAQTREREAQTGGQETQTSEQNVQIDEQTDGQDEQTGGQGEQIGEQDTLTGGQDAGNKILNTEAGEPRTVRSTRAGKTPGMLSAARKMLTPRRIATTAAVILLCAAAGYTGVKYISAAAVEPVETGATYQASADLYNLTGLIERKNERGEYAADDAANTSGTPDTEQGTPSNGDRASITATLYPLYNVDDHFYIKGLSNYYNFIDDMASRMSSGSAMYAPSDMISYTSPGTASYTPSRETDPGDLNPGEGAGDTTEAPAPGSDTEAGDAKTGVDEAVDVESDGSKTGVAEAGAAESGAAESTNPEAPAARSNPTIPAPEPFPVDILSVISFDDVLITGKLNLTNNSDFVIENAYLMISLTYIVDGAPIEETCYAFVKNVNLDPGALKLVSFAAIPPVEGIVSFTPADISLTAFDTHIDGEPYKMYYDPDQAYLEVLAVGSY